jgi:hypothetical protein
MVYTPSDIQILLKIGRNATYKLLKTQQFPVIHIGKKIVIPKTPFENWVNNIT